MQSSNPTVSVCIATFNQEAYIEDCIMSVLSNSASASVEVLVGDDASSDATGEIVRMIAANNSDRLRYIRHERNLGPCANYKYLIDLARGDFIAHLDGDDFWLPGKVDAQLAHFEKNRSCVAVYTNAIVVTNNKMCLGVFNNIIPNAFDTDFLIEKGNFLNHSSIMYRARYKGELLTLEAPFIDYRMHIRLSRNGSLGYINQVLSGYRVGVATSMAQNLPEHVRTMTWQAIREARGSLKRPEVYTRSLSLLWAQTVCVALLRGGKAAHVRYWLVELRAEAPAQFMSIIVVGSFKAVVALLKNAVMRCIMCVTGSRLRVYHCR